MGPVCVTLKRCDSQVLAMVRTALGTDHLRIPLKAITQQPWYERLMMRKWPAVEDVLRAAKHPLASAEFVKIKNRTLGTNLIMLDEKLVVGSHKIGLVFAGPGQSEFRNILANNSSIFIYLIGC